MYAHVPKRNIRESRGGLRRAFSIQSAVQDQFGIGKYDEWSRPTRSFSRLRNYRAFIRITCKRVVFLKLRMEETLEAAADDASPSFIPSPLPPPWKHLSRFRLVSFLFEIINITLVVYLLPELMLTS